VRTFDPNKDYHHSQPGLRASAPSTQIDIKQSGSPNVLPKVAEDESPNSKPRPGGAEEVLTPSDSATSYISDKSDSASRHQNSFQAVRNRAASAPMQSGSFSLGSNSTTSREGSKYDVHTTTILSNGEVEEGGGANAGRDRKASTKTMGRRRSKLKLGLAFWKRTRSNDKSVGEGSAEGRPDSEGSGG
jgi:hypothetical protein